MKNSFILLMAGSGTRTGLKENKTLHLVNAHPVFYYSLKKAIEVGFDEYILVHSQKIEEKNKILNILKTYNLLDTVKLVEGGSTRGESVKNAIKNTSSDVAFIHDAARPLVTKVDLINLINASSEYRCGTLYHNVADTLKQIDNEVTTIDRNKIYAVSTPQFFHKSIYQDILNNNIEVTDEIAIFEKHLKVAFIKEEFINLKITTIDDLNLVKTIMENKSEKFIGHSLDYHPFSESGSLILGGVIFNDYPQLHGHSDADVVYHVVTEAIMGASGLGDLGTLFPDTDPLYKGISSSLLLKEVMKIIKSKDIHVHNIDLTVYLLKPNLKDYKKQMEENIMNLTNCKNVNVKAATLNKKGLIALNEGIGAECVVYLKKNFF